jgi:hypothetical protein
MPYVMMFLMGVAGIVAENQLAMVRHNLDAVSTEYAQRLAKDYVDKDCGLAAKEFALYTPQDQTCVEGAKAKARQYVDKLAGKAK